MINAYMARTTHVLIYDEIPKFFLMYQNMSHNPNTYFA
jgi:hypothetical protein